MLDFCLGMSISSTPSLMLLWNTCIEWNSPITVDWNTNELKAKSARRLRHLRQITSSIATVVIWAVVFWKSGLHAQWRTALPIWEIWTTAGTKYSWFFNMAANKSDLTTSFNGNFWYFLITKSSFCLGKTYAKVTKIRYLLKFKV